jgi:hypothetical protein
MFLNSVKPTSKISKYFKCVLIFLYLQWLLSYCRICDFFTKSKLQNISEPMLPPGGRNRQLTYPNFPEQQLPLTNIHCAQPGACLTKLFATAIFCSYLKG